MFPACNFAAGNETTYPAWVEFVSFFNAEMFEYVVKAPFHFIENVSIGVSEIEISLRVN
jgi:hypothetical protein